MPEVQILDDTKYGKALFMLLYQLGGTFRSRPVRKLLISPWQYQALVEAGLVEPENGKEARSRGKKKKSI
jgi:hypothetical protein